MTKTTDTPVANSIIALRRVGTQHVQGTDWPIEDYVERCELHGRVEWTAVRGRCNGSVESYQSFSTRREALDFADLAHGEGMDD